MDKAWTLTQSCCAAQAATTDTNQTVAEAERLKAEAEADRLALEQVCDTPYHFRPAISRVRIPPQQCGGA